MEAMYLLIVISVVFVVAIGAAFWWAIFAGQFDNSDAAGRSILHDDDTGVGDRADEDQAAQGRAAKDKVAEDKVGEDKAGEGKAAKTQSLKD